jgi:hypothetical protein
VPIAIHAKFVAAEEVKVKPVVLVVLPTPTYWTADHEDATTDCGPFTKATG